MNLIVLFLAGLAVGILITWIFEFILKSNKKLKNKYYSQHEILFGYHVHHSTYGLMFLAVSILLFFKKDVPSAVFYLGVAVGIIVEHTRSEGRFVFLEKWKA